MAIDHLLLIGILLAVLAIPLEKIFKNTLAWLYALYPAGLFAYGFSNLADLSVTHSTREWIPNIAVRLSFGLDDVGSLFWLMVTGIGTLIFIYAGGYMQKDLGRLLTWLVAFTVAMLGIVSSQNVFALFVSWELTSITSFMLIGFKFTYGDSRSSAMQAMLITGLGGLVLLAGLALLTLENGSAEFANITSASPWAVVLIAIGCFTKSAQFPFHFWLPNAMAAPTPVSAFLHSATMVKAGVFLLAKLAAVFGPQPLIAYIGATTLVLGSLLSLGESDLKRILAWSTVAALGSMVMLAGIGTPLAAEALAVTIIAHAAYKGALFMVAGTIDHLTGTRDVFRLGKLGKKEPVLAAAALLAGLSMAGLPVFVGFVAKEAQLGAFTEPVFLVAIVFSGIASIVAAYNVAWRPFWSPPLRSEEHASPHHKSNFGLVLGPAVLAVVGLLDGIFVTNLGEHFLSKIASQVSGEQIINHLALWHGVNTALVLSGVAVALGIITTVLWPKIYAAINALRAKVSFTSESLFKGGFKLTVKGGETFARQMVGLSVRQHMIGYFTAFVLLWLAVFLIRPYTFQIASELQDIRNFHEVMLCVFAIVAATAATLARNRMGAVATLGVIGVAITLTYVTFSAPDLALTQLMIEVLSVILFVLLFSRLPSIQTFNDRWKNIRDAIVAASFGLVMMFLVLGVLNVEKPTEVSDYFAETSYEVAKGRNVVNTILVDFRALDTMGEITVLCVAALGAHTLIRLRPIRKGKVKEEKI